MALEEQQDLLAEDFLENEENELMLANQLNVAQEEERARFKKETVDKIKKKIGKKITLAVLTNPLFWTISFWIAITIFGLLVLYLFYIFLTNPCQAAKIFGNWFAQMLGQMCDLTGQ